MPGIEVLNSVLRCFCRPLFPCACLSSVSLLCLSCVSLLFVGLSLGLSLFSFSLPLSLPPRGVFVQSIGLSLPLIPTDGRRRAPSIGVVADRAAASKNAAKNDAGRTRRRGGGRGAPTLAALMMVGSVDGRTVAVSMRGALV